jgi:CRISPR-associated protein Cmr2
MTNTYLAITIGPIYETMMLCRKTREFWAASLLISLLSKELCEALKKNKIKEEDFVVPHQEIFKHDMKDIGLYLDRIICKVDGFDIKEIETKIIIPAFENLAKFIGSVKDAPTADILKSYFKVYATLQSADESKPISDVSTTLNTLELFNIQASNSTNQKAIQSFLKNVNTKYNDDHKVDKGSDNFIKNYYTKNDFNGHVRIPSIIEISTAELQKNKSEILKTIFNNTIWKKNPEEENVFKEINKNEDLKVKNYHKYYAILQADGDKLGSFLMRSKSETIRDTSKDLIDWCKKDALVALLTFNALPIYIGGDDVLCFAPVNNGSKNIIELAYQLNQSYCNKKSTKEADSTLSISIQMSYYKSPMYESYQKSFPLLRKVAKENMYNGKKANSCSIQLELHSGQPHVFTFNFAEEYTQYILPLMSAMNINENKKSFLNSVMYAIRVNEKILQLIYTEQERFSAFFVNNFDEFKENKKGTQEYQFIEAVKNYLLSLFQLYKDKKIDDHEIFKATSQLYSAIKIIRFIKGLDYDHQ